MTVCVRAGGIYRQGPPNSLRQVKTHLSGPSSSHRTNQNLHVKREHTHAWTETIPSRTAGRLPRQITALQAIEISKRNAAHCLVESWELCDLVREPFTVNPQSLHHACVMLLARPQSLTGALLRPAPPCSALHISTSHPLCWHSCQPCSQTVDACRPHAPHAPPSSLHQHAAASPEQPGAATVRPVSCVKLPKCLGSFFFFLCCSLC